MAKADVDWLCRRPNCETCKKAEAWLAKSGNRIVKEVNCKQEPLDAEAAVALARKASQLYATRGQKVVHIDLKKERPDDDLLRSLVVGPSGKLRAPTLRAGKTLVVGFQEQLYGEQLG